MRKPCVGLSLPDDAQLASLAALKAEDREIQYWTQRDYDWASALAKCEKRRAGAVQVTDAHRATAEALKTQLERPRGWLPWGKP